MHDRLDVLHWAVENGYKLYRSAEKAVIQKGSADTLEWMIHSEEADEEKIIDWGRKAAKAGNLELVRYLLQIRWETSREEVQSWLDPSRWMVHLYDHGILMKRSPNNI